MPSIRPELIHQRELWAGLEQLEGCSNPTLRWILHGFDENFEKKLDQLKVNWNNKVRAFYRDVLSLNTKNTPIHTTYKLDDNGHFIRLVEEKFPNLDFAEFVALRRYIDEVEGVETYYTNEYAREALLKSKEYASERLEAYDLKDIIETLFDFYKRSPESDVFGRYYLKKHAIEIYIVPCIIFSMLIEEDFLDMAIGTLAHELAHGFHHVGADKDGVIWENYGYVAPALVEGLAEYYTREFSRTVESSRPTVLSAFNKTSKYLPEIYRRYEQWGDDFGLEAVYQAFIEARRNDVRDFDVFQQSLNKANNRLGTGD